MPTGPAVRNLATIDLNLLIALDALMAEGSVTGAAKRIGLSQPGMSNALRRLRAVLEDPVLVRSPRGMIPTARAVELSEPIRQALAQIQRALTPPPDQKAVRDPVACRGLQDTRQRLSAGWAAGAVGRQAPRRSRDAPLLGCVAGGSAV